MKISLALLLFIVTFLVEPIFADNLKGSPSSLQKQNERADKEGLVRIVDDSHLFKMKNDGLLVRLPTLVKIDERLQEKWQWVLPQAATFLENQAIEFINKFGKLFKVNSAVRTVSRQTELILINPNAAPVFGDRMSSHLTGASIDIAKIGMNKAELEWMRKKLSELEDLNLIEATEEHEQLVFHIMVYKTYPGHKSNN